MALAAVAFVGVFATSCSEEDLNVNNQFELPAATASVSVSVVDLSNFTTLGAINTVDATASIGATMTVNCPEIPGYTVAKPVEVAIPAIQKGQTVNVPVTFYVANVKSALAEIMDSWEVVAGSERIYTEEVLPKEEAAAFENKSAYDKEAKATFDLKSGKEFKGVAARTTNDLVSILSTLKFNTYEGSYKFFVPAWMFATVKGEQTFVERQYICSYNNEKETVVIAEAGAAICNLSFAVIPGFEHDYEHNNHGSHGHGHGDNNNAGGGIIEAE